MTRHRIAQIGENRNPKSPENRSQTRRFLQIRILQLRRSATPFNGLAVLHGRLFVTLSLGQDARLSQARQLLRQWFARLDDHYLGRCWARRSSDQRTFAILMPENISTNLHYHCLMRLPSWGQAKGIADCAATLERFWRLI